MSQSVRYCSVSVSLFVCLCVSHTDVRCVICVCTVVPIIRLQLTPYPPQYQCPVAIGNSLKHMGSADPHPPLGVWPGGGTPDRLECLEENLLPKTLLL